jgi:hypothetical protein
MADVGTGASDHSLQLVTSLNYSLPKFSVIGGYRYIAVDYESDGLLLDISLAGPMIGLSWHF